MSVNKNKKIDILKRDNYICQYCGKNLIFEELEKIHLDHFISKNLGGLSEKENLKTSCEKCNCSKNYKDIEEWRLELINKINERIEFLNYYGIDIEKITNYKFYFENYGKL
jgi:5-methylcytosine-specific restriction endonuclease McrA